jgi:exopolysaccharide production protein ExoZ
LSICRFCFDSDAFGTATRFATGIEESLLAVSSGVEAERQVLQSVQLPYIWFSSLARGPQFRASARLPALRVQRAGFVGTVFASDRDRFHRRPDDLFFLTARSPTATLRRRDLQLLHEAIPGFSPSGFSSPLKPTATCTEAHLETGANQHRFCSHQRLRVDFGLCRGLDTRRGDSIFVRIITSVQALRAIAAISVVICHFSQVQLMLIGHPNDPTALYPLASGVDLFFVISGFIMVYSSEDLFSARGGWYVFLVRRIARIVPLYWITTAIAIPVLSQNADWANVVTSYLFIPYQGADGRIVPLNGVGWTLNFEMLFYVLFAATIYLPRKTAISCLCVLLGSLVLFGYWTSPKSAVLKIWSDPIVLEFAFGMLIATLYRQGTCLPAALRFCLVVTGAAAIWLSAPNSPPTGHRLLLWGIPAAAIVAAAVLGRRDPDTGPAASCINLIGGSSYCLYLIHPLVGGLVLRWWAAGLNRYPMTSVLAVAAIFALSASVVIYWFFESWSTKAIQRVLMPRAPSPGNLLPALPIPSRSGATAGE